MGWLIRLPQNGGYAGPGQHHRDGRGGAGAGRRAGGAGGHLDGWLYRHGDGAARPQRLAGIALLNTQHRADPPERRRQREATIEMAQSDRFRGVTRHLMKSFLSPAALADETLVARVIAMAEEVGRENFVLQQRAILGRRDQSDTLGALAVPALVLGGGLDTLTPPQASRDMAELIPDAELVIMEEIGHLSTIEAPDKVTDILNAYLARLAA